MIGPNVAPHVVRPCPRPWLWGLLLAAALAAAACAENKAQATPQVGKAAPDFALVDTQGKMRKLSELRGEVVVLEWTNHDCPFVKKHYESGNMQQLQREARAHGVVWLSVISSAPGKQGHVTADQANALSARRKSAPAGILLDPSGELGHSYAAQTTPHMFVIDTQGVLRYMGGIDSIPSTKQADIAQAEPLFLEAMTAVVEGKPVKKAVTRPYGCSVKYGS